MTANGPAGAGTHTRARVRGHPRHDFERGFYKGMRLWLTPVGVMRFAHYVETLALREVDRDG